MILLRLVIAVISILVFLLWKIRYPNTRAMAGSVFRNKMAESKTGRNQLNHARKPGKSTRQSRGTVVSVRMDHLIKESVSVSVCVVTLKKSATMDGNSVVK